MPISPRFMRSAIVLNSARYSHSSLKVVQARYDAGLETIDLVRLAEARLPQTKSDLAATDEAILLDKHALQRSSGRAPTAPSGSAGQRSRFGRRAFPRTPRSISIGRRPDIAASRTRVEAAEERIKEARAAFFPNINIAALAGFQSLGLAAS